MSQIKLFSKNIIDQDSDNTTLTVTDAIATDTGQAIVNFVRNRSNNSAWLTTNSTDAANTVIDVILSEPEDIDTLILIGHNFKSFTIQYYNSGWQDFSTPINETTNADGTTYFSFNSVSTDQIKITITGTQVANEDKMMKQLIITNSIATLNAYPKIKSPRHARSRSIRKMLSGKRNYVSQVGGFSVKLSIEYLSNNDDIEAIEGLFIRRTPTLVWLCGGDESQFKALVQGYRLEDIYLMRPSNDYEPQWYESIYNTGLEIDIELVEVVD